MPEIFEIILGVEEITEEEENGIGGNSGYRIITNEQEILLLISNYQSCCESWGYFLTEDDPESFIGEHLYEIEVTDTNRSARVVFAGYREPAHPDKEIIHLDDGDTLFVDIKTSRGVLQFAAYNAHNGYYGHSARIISKQLNFEKVL